jgi:hypothetical protein
MNRFDDYPYSQFREALGSTVGRVLVVGFAVFIGVAVAGITATRSLAGVLMAMVELPDLTVSSLFFGIGIFVLPFILVFTFAFARSEWPLWAPIVCSVLMWWNMHGTIRWALYDSPLAKKMESLSTQMEYDSEQAKQRVRERESKKNSR